MPRLIWTTMCLPSAVITGFQANSNVSSQALPSTAMVHSSSTMIRPVRRPSGV